MWEDNIPIAEGMEGNEWLSVWEDNISIAEGMEGNESRALHIYVHNLAVRYKDDTDPVAMLKTII